jgi:quinol monooxygenase YgiN
VSTVTVVAKLTVKVAAIEAAKAELLTMIAPTRAEEGCIEYRLHQDNDDPTVFIFYENWESLVCLERHMESEHFKCYVAALSGLIADKVVHKMTCIA